jgi:purine-binding chemotaxis protein CheW
MTELANREEVVASEKLTEDYIHLVVAGLADEEYGIPITKVQEIIKIPGITRIPNISEYIEGVINLRGKIIPVVDLRKKFQLAQKQKDDNTKIVIVNVSGQSIGLICDSVSEVIRLPSLQIEEVPTVISHISTDYLSGVGKIDNRIIILLNLEKILADIEKTTIKKIDKTAITDNGTAG